MTVKEYVKKYYGFLIITTLLIGSTTTLGIFFGLESKKSWENGISELPPIDKLMLYYTYCRELRINNLYFEVDLILHSSQQFNAFGEVDALFEKNNWNWVTSNSMEEVWFCINLHYPFIDHWNGSNDMHDIFYDINYLPYIYDEDILGLDDTNTEYIQAPIEMLHRRGGDCEDIAILGATIFENNGFNTIIASIRDVNYPGNDTGDGELNHAVFFVEVDSYHEKLWYFDGEDRYWFLIDLFWMEDIDLTPTWVTHYSNRSLSFSDWTDIMDTKEVKTPYE